MATQCTPTQLPFHPFGRREVVARFDAGHLTSDGGALLLRSDPLLALAAGKADPTGLRRGRTSPRRCREQPETPVSSPAGRRRPPSGRIEHRFVARNRPQPPNQGQRPE